jgi:TolB protein
MKIFTNHLKWGANFLALLAILSVLPRLARAQDGGSQIYIKVGEAQVKKSVLALPPLQYLGSSAATPNFRSIGAELFSVINNDLQVSSYFQMMDPKAFDQETIKAGLQPAPTDPKGFKFQSWQAQGTDFLIRAGYTVVDGQINLETYVYHVPKAQLVLGKKYRGTQKSLRRIAHTFCNDILHALTGQNGMFLSRIVLSSDRGGGKFREVYLMDWDGSNIEKITNHKTITVSPAWSPDGKKIGYTAFVKRARSGKRNADLFIYELNSGNRWLVSYKEGINSGINFSPDNKTVYLTISQGNSPDIYQMTYEGNLVKKITNGPLGAMNVEPAISADGTRLAFSSDRSGKPMIYVMGADGSNPQRITVAGKYNSSPSWSPDGKKIAFAGQIEDHFDIFVMNPDGTDMVRLTSAHRKGGKWADNEDPSFSPDGRQIIFSSNRTGSNQIYIINPDGSNERRITLDKHNYYKPKWSKNLD